MRRREFMLALGGAAAWPLAARAQRPPMPMIGYIGNRADNRRGRVPFLKGLSETGYAEGRNVAIDYRFFEAQNDRLPTFVSDLFELSFSLPDSVPP
jgi:hypothetical protein